MTLRPMRAADGGIHGRLIFDCLRMSGMRPPLCAELAARFWI
jgi:hypothetical protein